MGQLDLARRFLMHNDETHAEGFSVSKSETNADPNPIRNPGGWN
jgi:hypothetical protein